MAAYDPRAMRRAEHEVILIARDLHDLLTDGASQKYIEEFTGRLGTALAELAEHRKAQSAHVDAIIASVKAVTP